MDYEKTYKEALELMKDCVPDENGLVHVRPCDIFTELKESEDAKVRKWLCVELRLLYQRAAGDREREERLIKAIAWVEKQGEQKPAEWSEGDARMFESALWHIKNSCGNQGKNSGEFEVYNWFKSLKDRVQPKQEWSEEDARMLNEVILDLKVLKDKESGEAGKAAYQREIDWLKSLKDRYTWRPSEEQISCLYDAVARYNREGFSAATLTSLLEQLKKLREE